MPVSHGGSPSGGLVAVRGRPSPAVPGLPVDVDRVFGMLEMVLNLPFPFSLGLDKEEKLDLLGDITPKADLLGVKGSSSSMAWLAAGLA